MKKNTLSKSTFIRGLQCHKSLYLHKKRSFLRDRLSPEQLAKFKRGTNVGVLARELFPGGFDASPPTHFQSARALETTHELVVQKHPFIYEAYFSHTSVVVALDILEHRDGKWYGYEVKSSLSISETYLNDAALQYHVISNCGIELEGFSIIYMNKDYVLQGELDLNQLFTTQSVLEETRSRQPMIAKEIAAQLKVVELPKSPTIDIGPQCNKPYPCDFQGHCWKHIPKNSIFELQWLSEEQKFELYSKKFFQTEDIPDDFLSDPVQKMKLQAHKTATPYINKDSIRQFVEKTEYPLCFLKAWYYRPAVPLYEGTRPYEKLPFFLSMAMKHHKDASPEISHYYFDPETNPLPAFHQMLNEMLSQCKSILVYDDYFPGTFATKIEHPEKTKHVRIFDLFDILTGDHFYNPNTIGDERIETIASNILNVKTGSKDIYNSETEAATTYLASQGNENEKANFQRIIERSSELYLEGMERFYGLLAGY
jgi:hypothetical protein